VIYKSERLIKLHQKFKVKTCFFLSMEDYCKANEKTRCRLGENICKSHIWQRIHIYDVPGTLKINNYKSKVQLENGQKK
jgi:hypothetical protein